VFARKKPAQQICRATAGPLHDIRVALPRLPTYMLLELCQDFRPSLRLLRLIKPLKFSLDVAELVWLE
jgi:hypothetical protein